MERRIQSKKPFQSNVKRENTNGSYQVESYDFEANEEDEGNINNFQIYHALSKQITDGGQIMPQYNSRGSDDRTESPASNQVNKVRASDTNLAQVQRHQIDNQVKRLSQQPNPIIHAQEQPISISQAEYEEDEQFFDQNIERQKKRSLTDDKKFLSQPNSKDPQDQKQQKDLISQIQSKGGNSTDSTYTKINKSNQNNNKKVRIQSNQYSDFNSEDYQEKTEPITIGLMNPSKDFMVHDFYDQEFKQLKFNQDIKHQIIRKDSASKQQRNKAQKLNQSQNSGSKDGSYLQYWVNKGINYKYKLPWTSLAKVFTEFHPVSFDQKDLPLTLLDQSWVQLEQADPRQKKRRGSDELRLIKIEFEKKFSQIVLCTYRKGFNPLLSESEKLRNMVMAHAKLGESKIFTSTDVGWGCAIREDDPIIREKFRSIIRLILDNDGTKQAAFSIQNIAKMGFCHDKYPSEWYGHHAMSIMMRDLNKMYQPVHDFQICIYRDGNIYYDKLKKLAITDGQKFQIQSFQAKRYQGEARDTRCRQDIVFHEFLNQTGYFSGITLSHSKHHNMSKEFDSPKRESQISDNDMMEKEQLKIIRNEKLLEKAWRNGILIIIPTRLGLNKVNKEYFYAIQYILQFPLNVGILGGRPQQALYFDAHVGHHLDQNVMQTYQCDQAKKISLTKIDTSLAFGFFIKDFQDYQSFANFIETGKKVYKENWVFSIFKEKPSFDNFTPSMNDNFYLPKTTLGFEQISNRISKPLQSPQSNNQQIQQKQEKQDFLTINALPLNRNRSTNVQDINPIKIQPEGDEEFELI
ncbi:UNKNOWN [Stylonychia lemnae]|uniref:Cysteine protease n=1 Tax=Stylonychia lemnae TaxID=5949 RepID=A0A078ABB0_STYLE|nr:UNKNOWN [Stylonychia lemnae]|eukprot:CDW79449.1 UNKNOWN [Stylonychia lemnae]